MSENEKIPLDSDKGKQTVDALLAKMTPEQQEQFKASLQGDKPVHVHIDKDGKVVLGEAAEAAAPAVQAAPEAPVEVKKEEPRKLSKVDEKRQRIFMDRLKRKMGEKGKDGQPKTQEQALQEMQREDFDKMPLDKKFARLESLISNALRNISVDIMNLNQEHAAIADAFDINYRATAKMFMKLGIPPEEQKAFIDEAQKEVIELRKKQMDQMQAQAQAQRDAAEQARIEPELKNQPKVPDAAAAAGAELPKEATVFGG